MDAAVIIVAAIVGASIIGAFIMMSRRGTDNGEDAAELIRLAEEKAKAEAELESTRADLDAANQHLDDARQFEIQNASLKTDLANEKCSARTRCRRTQINTIPTRPTPIPCTETHRGCYKLETELKNRKEGEKTLVDRFNTVSSENLANQHKQFIERARETLKPLSDKVEKLDREWVNTSGAFKQQIESLTNETRTLSSALTRPQARGQVVGEWNVERVLEHSGLTKGIHYETQVSDAEGGRPDFVVHMPDNRDIVLDSKVSLVAYLDAHEAKSQADRVHHLDRHARQMQIHANDLAQKEYGNNLPNSPDFVVMVVPDFALPPAVERRPNIIDDAYQKDVVICAHSTLGAFLKIIAMGWQERKIADEAGEVARVGRELHDRIEVFARHYAELGRDLDRVLNHYNDGIGSLERNVMSSARRFPQLGVHTTKELPETQPIETTIRSMRSAPNEDNSSAIDGAPK